MRCEECEILISADADGELSATEIAEMKSHINLCGSCRQIYEDTIRLQRNITNALREPMETPDLVSAVNFRIRHTSKAKLIWAWAAVLVLLTISCYIAFRPVGKVEPTQTAHTTRHRSNQVVQRPRVPSPKAVVVTTGTHKRVNTVLAPERKVINFTPQRTHDVSQKVHNAPEPVRHINSNAPAGIDAAEIIVEYSDGELTAGHIADLAELAPVTGPGKEVVARNETTIINGKKTERMCYRIIDTNDKENLDQGDSDEMP